MKEAAIARPPQWQTRLGPVLIGLTVASTAFVGLAAFATSTDFVVSDSVRGWHLPGDLRKAIHLSETFAHSLGAAAILGCIMLTAGRERRPALWLAVLITCTSGLVANSLKGCFTRVRPHSQEQILEAGELPTAGQVQVAQSELKFWDSRQRSFPSGHAAVAWGLMIGLSLAFPRSTPLFALLASAASFQRIESGAHFPSDVFAGAAIACLSALVILSIIHLSGLGGRPP